MKGGGQQELIVKRNYGWEGQQTLADMAHQLGLYLYVLQFVCTSVFFWFLAEHSVGPHYLLL